MTNDSKTTSQRNALAYEIWLTDRVRAATPGGAPSEFDHAVAGRLIAAGYRKPRTITAVEELDGLPTGTVIRADNAEVFEKQADGPYCDGPHDWQSMQGTFWNGETFVFPAAVLYEPEAEATR